MAKNGQGTWHLRSPVRPPWGFTVRLSDKGRGSVLLCVVGMGVQLGGLSKAMTGRRYAKKGVARSHCITVTDME